MMLRKMKKLSKIYIYTMVLSVLLFNGCTDVLEEQPRTILTPEFFATGKGLQAGLTAAYAHFRRYYASEGGMNLTVYGTDEYGQAQQVNNPPFAIYGGITPDRGELGSAWNNAYPAINTCNGIVEIGPSATDLLEAEKKQLIAEAKYIRANWYFILVRTFGGASLDLGSGPLAFNTTPTNELTRASEAEVYEAIIQDLEDAVTDLPDERPTAPGHAWKASALHLLAKVYLARGWNSNNNADFQEAYNNASDLIDNRGQYGVGLEASYGDVHKEDNEWGQEVLWTIEWNGQEQYNNVTDHGSQENNGSAFYFREFYVQDVPGMIRDVENGRPWIRYNPTPWMIDVAFADKVNDERYDGSFQTVWYVNDENSDLTLGDTAQWHAPLHFEQSFGTEAAAKAWADSKNYVVSFPNYGTSSSYQGVGRNYQNKHFPSLSKFNRTARPVSGTEEDPNIASTRPFIVYRFGETLLVAAEAALKLGQTGEAVNLINELRGRAKALPISEADLTGPHGDEIDFILDERTRELAGEQMRWFDLKRTGRLIERVSVDPSVGTGAPAVFNRQYNNGSPASGQDGPRPLSFHLLRPIPQSAIDAVVGDYGQNPGYAGN
jgi:hypothetical protein